MATLPLLVDGVEVARYDDGADIPAPLSPRPFLHPVRSPAGAVVTQEQPADHLHHLGMSLAIADVSGTSHWGGKSYVHPGGYTMLPNQGRQVGEEPRTSVAAGTTTLQQRLRWDDHDGVAQVHEDREIELGRAEVAGVGPATTVRWRSVITPAAADLLLGSPATRGRVGAGYGGLFWRVGPEQPARVRTARVEGEGAVLGTTSPWLALTLDRADGPVTLLLAQPEEGALPWFVRTSGYVGAGPAVAWDPDPVPLPAGRRRDLQLWVAVVDGEVDDRAARTLHDVLATGSVA